MAERTVRLLIPALSLSSESPLCLKTAMNHKIRSPAKKLGITRCLCLSQSRVLEYFVPVHSWNALPTSKLRTQRSENYSHLYNTVNILKITIKLTEWHYNDHSLLYLVDRSSILMQSEIPRNEQSYLTT